MIDRPCNLNHQIPVQLYASSKLTDQIYWPKRPRLMHPVATIFHPGHLLSSVKSSAAALCRLKCELCCLLSRCMESMICVNPILGCVDFKGLELHFAENWITICKWTTHVLVSLHVQHKKYKLNYYVHHPIGLRSISCDEQEFLTNNF